MNNHHSIQLKSNYKYLVYLKLMEIIIMIACNNKSSINWNWKKSKMLLKILRTKKWLSLLRKRKLLQKAKNKLKTRNKMIKNSLLINKTITCLIYKSKKITKIVILILIKTQIKRTTKWISHLKVTNCK